MTRHLRDPFVRQSAAESFASRAYAKLQPLLSANSRDRLGNPSLFVRPPHPFAVIDVGSAPGAWTQLLLRSAQCHAILSIDLAAQVQGLTSLREVGGTGSAAAGVWSRWNSHAEAAGSTGWSSPSSGSPSVRGGHGGRTVASAAQLSQPRPVVSALRDVQTDRLQYTSGVARVVRPAPTNVPSRRAPIDADEGGMAARADLVARADPRYRHLLRALAFPSEGAALAETRALDVDARSSGQRGSTSSTTTDRATLVSFVQDDATSDAAQHYMASLQAMQLPWIMVSDASPDLSGDGMRDAHAVLALSGALLTRAVAHGAYSVLLKARAGGDADALFTQAAQHYRTVRWFKPPASRPSSREMYLYATMASATSRTATTRAQRQGRKGPRKPRTPGSRAHRRSRDARASS